MKITILTTTFNRAYSLEKLYKSLEKQTSKNFEWLVVDDGSTDNTKALINSYIGLGKFKIKYIYQDNGGKHRALNNGIKNIENDMTFIVDSDDYLKEDAIETIEIYDKKYNGSDRICGYSFLRCYPDGKINGPEYEEYEFISDYIKYRLNKHNWGDKAEVYYTKYLKEFPFIEIDGENFLVESYVWAKMALKYDTVYINKPIYVGDYLDDGLTKNVAKKKFFSPIGMIEKSKILCNKKASIKVKSKAMINYIAYSLIANKSLKEQYKYINNRILFVLMYPLGLAYKVKLVSEVKKM